MEIALLKVRSQALFAGKNISDTHHCSDALITFCHILTSSVINCILNKCSATWNIFVKGNFFLWGGGGGEDWTDILHDI